ncbi:MAG: MFS transporter [Lentisphaerae bacterium]|nr:MFS transporter [Lentisphaerota bacterium]
MITALDIKKTKRWMTLAEIPAGISWAGLGLTYLTGFFLMLKATSFQIGLLTAIPALCSLSSILGGHLLGRWKSRRACVVSIQFVFYLSFAFLGAIPFLFHAFAPATQVWLGLGLLAAAYALVKIQEIFWYPWASEIVPEGQRGKLFSRLLIMGTLINMPASYVIGKYLDHHNTLSGFFIVFAVCAFIGALVGFFYMKIPDVRSSDESGGASLGRQMLVPLRDPHFRMVLLFALFYTLEGGLIGPFSTVFMIESLRIPYTHIALFGILSSAVNVLFLVVWGYLVDKYGSRPVLLICAAPASLFYLLWIFNSPENYRLIPIVFFLSGITAAGLNLALQNLLMGFSTGKHSAGYLTLYQVGTGLIGFAAPLLGGAVVELFKDARWIVGGCPIGKYQVLFAVAGVLSLLPLFFIVRLHEPRGKTAMFLLRNMIMVNPLKLALHLFSFHRSVSEKQRLSATVGLGSTGSPMVVGELINSLDDPNYFVRHEAALALGRIRDRDAVMPLIAKLADEYANIQHEAAWALGNIKDDVSIPPLLESLKSRDHRLRSYAATALGEIGASLAIDPLCQILEHSQDVLETTCAANALSRLGYKKALWKTLEKLVASDQPVVRRQLSVSLGDLLGEQGLFYRLLAHEEKIYGDEVSRMLAKMGKAIERRWQTRLGAPNTRGILQGLKRILDLYETRQYAPALKEVVDVSEQLFGLEIHRYNYPQEIGRKFLKELLGQNEALGNRVYWEECLLSIFELNLMFKSTEVR